MSPKEEQGDEARRNMPPPGNPGQPPPGPGQELGPILEIVVGEQNVRNALARMYPGQAPLPGDIVPVVFIRRIPYPDEEQQ